MQDRTSANSMKVLLQRTAGPYIGSKAEKLDPSIRCPLCAKSTHRDESRRDESAKMFVAIRLANPPAGLALGL